MMSPGPVNVNRSPRVGRNLSTTDDDARRRPTSESMGPDTAMYESPLKYREKLKSSAKNAYYSFAK